MSYFSRKVVQSTIVVGLICAPVIALAADFAPPPVGKAMPYAAPMQYRWDGFYVGINGGGAFGHSSWALAGSNAFSTGHWMAGVTGGYNMRFAGFVVGLEGDFDYMSGGGATSLVGCGAGCTLQQKYMGTVRGRVGIAFDRFLTYFTAGGAIGQIEYGQGGVGTTSSWRLGYAVGAGIEAAAWGDWSVKGEYLFVDFGNYNCGAVCGGNVNYYTNVWRLGLNYRF